jgi:hypothetical protein
VGLTERLPAVRVRVPGFTPATGGLPFPNAFPSAPFWRLQLGRWVRVEIGDVANGLCGGMTFVVADAHRAGVPPPPDEAAPGPESALWSRILRRQVDSFDGGRLPLRFYSLMSPLRPPRERPWTRLLARVGVDLHSRTHVMIAREWPRIRREFDAGRLVPLGLVRAVSANPLALTRNHQVLGWGYDLDGSRLTLRVYDPNWPGDDEVTISLDVADPQGGAVPAWSRPDGPVVAFFRAPYRPARPSAPLSDRSDPV